MRYCAIIIALLLFINCAGQSTEKVSGYYFPYKTFSKGVVYTYANQNDTTDLDVWEMKINVEGNDTLFLTDRYDTERNLLESLTEEITGNGAYMKKYSMGFYNADGVWNQVETKISRKDIYLWNAAKDEGYTWAVSYDPGNNLNVNESKTRTYTGEKVIMDFDNKKIDCLVYKDTFEVKYKNSEGDHFITYGLTCYYGKGYGLLRYTENLPNGKIKDFKLVTIR